MAELKEHTGPTGEGSPKFNPTVRGNRRWGAGARYVTRSMRSGQPRLTVARRSGSNPRTNIRNSKRS
jgi:hypothetical protein